MPGPGESPGKALPGPAKLILNTCWMLGPELGSRQGGLAVQTDDRQKRKKIKVALKYLMRQSRKNNTHMQINHRTTNLFSAGSLFSPSPQLVCISFLREREKDELLFFLCKVQAPEGEKLK